MATKVDLSSPGEPRRAQSSVSLSASPAGSSPKVSMFGAKSGFVIPKNKLSGSLVPIFRGSAKVEAGIAAKEENIKQVQRKTKWGADLTQDAAVRKGRALAYQTRLEQITQQLKSGALEIGDDQDYQSPNLEFGQQSTIHVNEKAKKFELLELEKREIIGEILRLNPSFKVPPDYKPVLKVDKVPIPIKEYPGYNFIGLLLGSESNAQKRLEEETGAKIHVYGVKADSKEKREITQSDSAETQGVYEELYVSVSADTYEKVDAAISLIELLLAPVSGNVAVASKTSAAIAGDSASISDQSRKNPASGYAAMANLDVSQVVPQPILGSAQPNQVQFQQQYARPWFTVPNALTPATTGFMPLSMPNNPVRFPTYFNQPTPFGSVPINPSLQVSRPPLQMQPMQQPRPNQAMPPQNQVIPGQQPRPKPMPPQNQAMPGQQPLQAYPAMSGQQLPQGYLAMSGQQPRQAYPAMSAQQPRQAYPAMSAQPNPGAPSSFPGSQSVLIGPIPPPAQPNSSTPTSFPGSQPMLIGPSPPPRPNPLPNMQPGSLARPLVTSAPPNFPTWSPQRPTTLQMAHQPFNPLLRPQQPSLPPLQQNMPNNVARPPSNITPATFPSLPTAPASFTSVPPQIRPLSVPPPVTPSSVHIQTPMLPATSVPSSVSRPPQAATAPQPLASATLAATVPQPAPVSAQLMTPLLTRPSVQSPRLPPPAVPTSSNMPTFTPVPTNSAAAPPVPSPKPLRPSSGDFTFQPIRAPVPASAGTPGPNGPSIAQNTSAGLLPPPQAPSFRPAPQNPPPQLLAQHSILPTPPPPRFPLPSSSAVQMGPPRPMIPAAQMGPPSFSPAARPGLLAGVAPGRPTTFVQPVQTQLASENQVYDPFSPTSISPATLQQGGERAKARKPETDPEYDDLMASVGLK